MKKLYKYSKMVMATLATAASLVSVYTQTNHVALAQEDAAKAAISVGIFQFNDHGSLNANREGFIDGLAELGYVEGENLTIDYMNANADIANLQSMSESLVNNNDYLFAIATPTAQSLAGATTEKPIIFSSVADPLGAGVVDSFEEPGRNLTGTTNIGPIAQQIDMLFEITPDAKKVGIIYNSSEVNAQHQVDIAVPEIEAHGAEAVLGTITSTNDISQVMGNLVKEVDSIYLVTDNYIASSMPLVGDIAKEAGLPVIGGSNDMIIENGLATFGLDYYELGVQSAEMLVRIIEEDLDPATVPVEKAKTLELIINEEYAEAIGVDPTTIKAPTE
ncbi:ABC transporter substrate binding protein [Fundicoccus sp. Sow4_D5]|uniref:ABC transporter substrate binding protein n=1 Tax=unclassified Fundicoccus TaxID=2761543 RepID=UPI003F914E2D